MCCHPSLSAQKHERPEGMKPKSAREERFAAETWEDFDALGKPVLALA